MRCAVWSESSGAVEKKKKVCSEVGELPSELYKNLVKQGVQNKDFKVIEADVPRTTCSETLLDPLKRVLSAFSAYNPRVGYCQGMNFFTAVILKFCDEESTFWILCSLLTNTDLESYYTCDMVGIRTDMQVLNDLLSLNLPNLHAHFVEFDIDISPFAMTWFLCLYSKTLPSPASEQVLDCVIHEGCVALFRAALAILKQAEQPLLHAQSVEHVFEVCGAVCGSLVSTDLLLENMYGDWLFVSNDVIHQLRQGWMEMWSGERVG